MKKWSLTVVVCFLLLSSANLFSQPQSENRNKSIGETSYILTIHVNGVFSTDVKLIGLNGLKFADEVAVAQNQTNEIKLTIPANKLPAQFVLRFDFKAKQTDTPYPSEMQVFMNRQNIDIYANPQQLNKTIRFENDLENEAWKIFSLQNQKQRLNVILLEQLLAGYTSGDSTFYKQTEKEYSLRVKEYNQWLDTQITNNKNLFISHLISFQKVSVINWSNSEVQLLEQRKREWFSFFDFSDTFCIRSQEMNNFMGAYMAIYGQSATEETKDSVFIEAGRNACELASKGDPLVYGWLVDYFYAGYEAYNIPEGIKMLQKHINDPNCLTKKRQVIIERLEGMQKLVPGYIVPDFSAETINGANFTLKGHTVKKSKYLLMFYNSECEHCINLIKELKQWYEKKENASRVDIITIAVDNDKETWKQFSLKENFRWTDVWIKDGINSKAAKAYYILSTPSLIVIDAGGKVTGLPQNIKEIETLISN